MAKQCKHKDMRLVLRIHVNKKARHDGMCLCTGEVGSNESLVEVGREG